MASNTLVRDALWQVSDQLQDTAPQFRRHKQDAMVHALNDAQRVIAKFLPSSCSRVDAIKLVPGTKQSIEFVPAASIKPGDGTAAVDRRGNRLLASPIRNMGADGETPGRAVRAVERVVLDQSDPNWHTSKAKVVTQIVYDPQFPKVFYVCPGVTDAADVWIEIPWLPDPIEIPLAGNYAVGGGSTLKLSVDDKFKDDAVNYVIARLHMIDSEVEGSAVLAAGYSQLFVSSINTQSVAMGLPDPKLRALPIPGGR